jgi:hypothetical protein
MPYTVAIRKNETGEVRQYRIDWDWETEDGDDTYWWTEGNYGCDCNRHLCFERAAESDPDFEEAKCGDGKYSVLYADLPSGERVQIDPL